MKTNENEELQSRREFFKSAAKAALPVVGAVVLGSLPIKLQAESSSSCSFCGGGCKGCSGSCVGSCSDVCTSCSGTCNTTCKGMCYRSAF